MAFSYITYTANGTAQWAFNFDYIAEEELVVSLDGSVVPATDYSVTPDGIGGFITFNVAPSVGVAIKIQRVTDLSEPVVTYSSGSALLASSLNLSNEQVLNAAQEVKDISQDAMTDVGNLATDLEAEEQARINADNTLQDNINAEATARQQGDSGLQQDVNTLDTQLNSTSVAIGDQAKTDSGSVSIGHKAGSDGTVNPAEYSVSVGTLAGGHPSVPTTSNTVSVGYNAGSYNQNTGAVAVGYRAGRISQEANSVAVGADAGYNNLGLESIAIGSSSDAVGGNAIALGANASASAADSIQLGDNTKAMTLQVGSQVVDLVNPPADPQVDQNKDDIADLDQALTTEIGARASGDQNLQDQIDNFSGGGTDPADKAQIQANTDQLNAANVAIGQNAEADAGSVSVGSNAGLLGSGSNSILIGANVSDQFVANDEALIIGHDAGQDQFQKTGTQCTVVGHNAHAYGPNSIAIGYGALAGGDNRVQLGGSNDKLTMKLGDQTISPTYRSPLNTADIPIGLTVFEQAGAGWLNDTGNPVQASGTWSGCFAATTSTPSAPVQEVVLFDFGVSTVADPDPTSDWDPTPGAKPVLIVGTTVALLSGINFVPGWQWPAVTQVPFSDLAVLSGQYLLARCRTMDNTIDNGWVLCGQTSTAFSSLLGKTPVVRNFAIERM